MTHVPKQIESNDATDIIESTTQPLLSVMFTVCNPAGLIVMMLMENFLSLK